MQREAGVYLWDALKAAEAVAAFTRGATYDSFARDDMMRSAVERQFQIVGEALNQLAKSHPQVAAKVRDLPRIVAFRNILVHGYAAVDYLTVWRLIEENLPKLLADLTLALKAEGAPPG